MPEGYTPEVPVNGHMKERRVNMKTTRKILALLFCLILAVSQFTAAQAESGAHAYYSTFSITLHNNIMLSRYGVTVYLDDQKVAHLEQGDLLTFGAWMADDRPHELRIVADESGIPDRVFTLTDLRNGSVLTVEIQSKHNQIKVRSYNLVVDGQTVSSVSPDMDEKVKLLGTIILTGAKILSGTK